MRREDNGRRSLLFQLRHAGWWWYAKAGGRYDSHAGLYDAAGTELGHVRTKERMKGQSDDEYLIDLIENGAQYHLRTAYLWGRPKGNRLNDAYLLKPNKWLVILSIKEQFASIKASLRGEDAKESIRIWDKNDLDMRISKQGSPILRECLLETVAIKTVAPQRRAAFFPCAAGATAILKIALIR